MRPIVNWAMTFAAIALSLGAAHASDYVAVYALVDKVVMEPNADHPERIQIWGVFAMAKLNDRNLYDAPQRGYLYFKLPDNKEGLARNEWLDFKQTAGKRQVVGFGNRHVMKPHVRKADEKPKDPDVYEVEMGLIKDRSNTDYPPIKSLLEYPDR